MQTGKAIIFSAPSGSGKTTIVKHLLEKIPTLEFSISATTRNPRPNETHAKDYYFLSPEEFVSKVGQGDFIEWEEVYSGTKYGTLKSEIDRIWAKGHHVIFDVDVKGGVNLKKYFGDHALGIFVKVPSVHELENRLKNRDTESEDSLQKRIAKFEYELTFEDQFDITVINDDLEASFQKSEALVNEFIAVVNS